jgi:hypothetical protein
LKFETRQTNYVIDALFCHSVWDDALVVLTCTGGVAPLNRRLIAGVPAGTQLFHKLLIFSPGKTFTALFAMAYDFGKNGMTISACRA